MEWVAYFWGVLVLLFIGFRIGYYCGDKDARDEISARLEEVRQHLMATHPEAFEDSEDA